MNKQIEEMARELCGLSIEYETCEMCNSEVKANCAYKSIVTTMMTIMVREIFEEIARYIRLNEDIAIKCKEENGEQNEEYFKGKLSAFKQIRGFIDVELKRQYKEGRNEA